MTCSYPSCEELNIRTFFFFFFLFFFYLNKLCASFVAEEWVNQALSNSWEAKNKLVNSDKALAEVEKKYKDPLFHLVEAELGRKNVEADRKSVV